ncbi:MAG: hypothetical protein J5504_11635 [Butyrivibrio sp.]|nr:hypothetical protein [Butyrivibrio sp.]
MVDEIKDYWDFKEILSKQCSVSESVSKRAQKILGLFSITNPHLYKEYFQRAKHELYSKR